MSIADEAEQYLRAVTSRPEPPRDGECLRCYLRRMLPAHGCDGKHRLVKVWQRHRTEVGPGLLRWLDERDGFCDCEVVMNVFGDELADAPDPPPLCPHVAGPAL